jgi:hypothetical protein
VLCFRAWAVSGAEVSVEVSVVVFYDCTGAYFSRKANYPSRNGSRAHVEDENSRIYSREPSSISVDLPEAPVKQNVTMALIVNY